MKSDFIVALTQLAAERGLPKETVLSAIEDALMSAYKKDAIAEGQNISVKLDLGSGNVTVHVLKTVVDDVTNDKAEITLPEARKILKTAQVGETIITESMPHMPGRIAAQTAMQVIKQRLRDAEREVVFKQFEGKEGEVFLVTLQKIEPGRYITVDLGRSEATMPISEQVPTERYRSNTKMRVLLKSVERTIRGPELIVSRADNLLLRRLFEMEVPEVYSGAVEIEAIAREPGSRSKIAVRATQDGVDPVGSCVGLRGVRIQNIVNELHNEKIDVVEWNKEMPMFVANALGPAQVMKVELNHDDGAAMAVVPERQLSLAIGRDGQNARLAARLTGWKVDIKSDVEYQVELEERARIAAEQEAEAAAIAAAEAEARAAQEAEDAAIAEQQRIAAEAEAALLAELEAEQAATAAELAQPANAADAPDTADDTAITEPTAELAEPTPAAEATPEPAAADIADTAEIAAELAEPAAAELEPIIDEAAERAAAEQAAAEQAAAEQAAAELAAAEEAALLAELEAEEAAATAAAEQAAAEQAAADAAAAAEQSASLRDLPEDVWQVRRPRVRRPVRSDSDAPGRIRFAEDIAGLRGGVTASRRNRRRPDQPPTGNNNAGGNSGGKRRRPAKKRR